MSARGGWGQWYPDAQVVWSMPGAGQRRSSPCFLSRNPSSLLSLAWPSRLEFFLFLIKTDSAGCQGWQGTQGHLLLAALCVGNEEFAM